MSEDQCYKQIEAYFMISGSQLDNRAVELTLTHGGSHFGGDWTLVSNSPDNRLKLPTAQGSWKLTGRCDDKGDHNLISIYAGDSGSLVATLYEVPTPFLSAWGGGSNFAGSGDKTGTKIDYKLGVLCA